MWMLLTLFISNFEWLLNNRWQYATMPMMTTCYFVGSLFFLRYLSLAPVCIHLIFLHDPTRRKQSTVVTTAARNSEIVNSRITVVRFYIEKSARCQMNNTEKQMTNVRRCQKMNRERIWTRYFRAYTVLISIRKACARALAALHNADCRYTTNDEFI